MRGWKVDGDDGWQDDDSLTVNGKNENLNLANNLENVQSSPYLCQRR